MASLIEIHYTVGILEKRSTGTEADFVQACSLDEEKLIDMVPAKCEEITDLVSDQISEVTLIESVEVKGSAVVEEMQVMRISAAV